MKKANELLGTCSRLLEGLIEPVAVVAVAGFVFMHMTAEDKPRKEFIADYVGMGQEELQSEIRLLAKQDVCYQLNHRRFAANMTQERHYAASYVYSRKFAPSTVALRRPQTAIVLTGYMSEASHRNWLNGCWEQHGI